MARLARIVAAGVPHLVTQRGNRRQPVFFGDDDYTAYSRLLAAGCREARTAIWAWCLMPTHVHLILVPSHADGLRAALGEAHRRYTKTVNDREGWRGYLWQGRFASAPVDEDHLLGCARYVELNPVRDGLARRADDWPWSSARAHLSAAADRRLGTAPLLARAKQSGGGDRVTDPAPLLDRAPDWAGLLRSGLDNETCEKIRAAERTGRPLGSKAFIARLEASLNRPLAKRKPGPKPKQD
ncbi:MAG: transposase [Proteobacteria bacterium]|nr:transposase [Pseudomonadota bacterium]